MGLIWKFCKRAPGGSPFANFFCQRYLGKHSDRRAAGRTTGNDEEEEEEDGAAAGAVLL